MPKAHGVDAIFPPTLTAGSIGSLSRTAFLPRIAYEDGFGCRSCGSIHAKRDATRIGTAITRTRSCMGVIMGTETAYEGAPPVTSTPCFKTGLPAGPLKVGRCNRPCPIL